MNTYISAIDYYLPSQIVKTRDMMAETKPERLGFSDTMIEDMVGIFEVRHASDEQKPSTLATIAAEKALAKFDGNIDDIGMVIFCGIVRDYVEPSTAHIVQKNLGLKNAVCFDVSNACIGFMTGIQIAIPAILSGTAKHVLVCTGERSSEFSKSSIPQMLGNQDNQYYMDNLGTLTVGDAGVAAIISPSESESGIIGLNFQSKGELAKLCHYRYNKEVFEGVMHMKEISNAMLKAHKRMLPQTLEEINMGIDEVDCLVTHQVGKTPWRGFSKILGVDQGLLTKTFDTLGNITSATFGVNYAKALADNKIKPGDLVLAAMAGSGLTICQLSIIA